MPTGPEYSSRVLKFHNKLLNTIRAIDGRHTRRAPTTGLSLSQSITRPFRVLRMEAKGSLLTVDFEPQSLESIETEDIIASRRHMNMPGCHSCTFNAFNWLHSEYTLQVVTRSRGG